MRHPELDPEYIAAEEVAYDAAIAAANRDLAQAAHEVEICRLRVNEIVARHARNLAARAEFDPAITVPKDLLRRRYDNTQRALDRASTAYREVLAKRVPSSRQAHAVATALEEARWQLFQRLNAEALAELLREEAARG